MRMVDRPHRALTDEDVARITGVYLAWQGPLPSVYR